MVRCNVFCLLYFDLDKRHCDLDLMTWADSFVAPIAEVSSILGFVNVIF